MIQSIIQTPHFNSAQKSILFHDYCNLNLSSMNITFDKKIFHIRYYIITFIYYINSKFGCFFIQECLLLNQKQQQQNSTRFIKQIYPYFAFAMLDLSNSDLERSFNHKVLCTETENPCTKNNNCSCIEHGIPRSPRNTTIN